MPTANQPIQEQVKQQERENVERQAATTGAEAVADAVKKVADAAVAQARGANVGESVGDFIITGTPGGRFEMRSKTGPIFSSAGTVHINGKPQVTHEWGADYIRGRLDPDVKSGEVVVQIDEKTKRVGYLKV